MEMPVQGRPQARGGLNKEEAAFMM
jgi:hypothetical protein